MNHAVEQEALRLEVLRAAADAFDRLQRVWSDITVAPDVWQALQRHPEWPACKGDLDVQVDERLPARAWHWGRPRSDAELRVLWVVRS